jgi:hypothetical protein
LIVLAAWPQRRRCSVAQRAWAWRVNTSWAGHAVDPLEAVRVDEQEEFSPRRGQRSGAGRSSLGS